jgi:hypothetical protein
MAYSSFVAQLIASRVVRGGAGRFGALSSLLGKSER